MPREYDYLIVGSGLFGAVFAQRAHTSGKKCLVIEKRDHIAGNLYTEEIEGIQVHRYGPHIFHTNNREVWDYVNQFAEFNSFVNSPLANYKGKIYNLPFSMNTFNQMWGVVTPEQAQNEIERQRRDVFTKNPQNLEQAALNMVGRDIYEKLIRGYTEKQWGCPCSQLPAFIIRRLPVRFTYDNNYFDAKYQGIPVDGYTAMVGRMLKDIDVQLSTDYLSDKRRYDSMADKVIYTGSIDAFYHHCFGALEYRSIRFDTEILDMENFQGNAVVNYTEKEIPHTRIIEHKHFNFGRQQKTVISYEHSHKWQLGEEPYYPIENEANLKQYASYKKLADSETNVLFGGRLGSYKYLDMDKVVEQALSYSRQEN